MKDGLGSFFRAGSISGGLKLVERFFEFELTALTQSCQHFLLIGLLFRGLRLTVGVIFAAGVRVVSIEAEEKAYV